MKSILANIYSELATFVGKVVGERKVVLLIGNLKNLFLVRYVECQQILRLIFVNYIRVVIMFSSIINILKRRLNFMITHREELLLIPEETELSLQ